MTLELRDAAPSPAPTALKVQYVKVTNPDNPREFVYVEKNFLDALKREAGDGMSGFFNTVWNGIKGAVGGFVTGGPIGAIAGAAAAVITPSSTPQVAVSTQAAAGTATISVTKPANQLTPAVVQPPPADDKNKKDNTMLYIGLAAAGALLLSRGRRN